MGRPEQRLRERKRAAANCKKLNGFFSPKRKCSANTPGDHMHDASISHNSRGVDCGGSVVVPSQSQFQPPQVDQMLQTNNWVRNQAR